jgi:phosphate:Na+ symporter
LFTHFVERITPGAADLVIATEEQARLLGGAVGDKPYIARHIANTHTLFNILNTIIFLPLVGLLAKLTTFLIRGKDEELEFHLKYIDNRVLNTPPIAFNQAHSEIKRMASISQEMFRETIDIVKHGVNDKRIAILEKKESNVDLLQKEISDFLVNLSQKSITEEMSRGVGSMLNMVNDLERLSDHCEHLWRLAERKKEEKISFSDQADEEMKSICAKAEEFIAFVVNSMDDEDTLSVVSRAKVMEDGIDDLEETLRNNHIARLNRGECDVNSGLIFVDMLHSLEKIGDHSFNVARALAGKK